MAKNSDEGVKLVGFWVSPFVHRVRWALKLKGVDYEYIEEDIFNKGPLLPELNPVHQKVPVLVHRGKSVPESFVILEYIDEIWKNNPLLPQDPYERAEARFWAKFSEEKLADASQIALCSEGEMQRNAVTSATEALEKIEDRIRGKSFFGGDEIGYLDLVIGFVSYLLPVVEEVASVKILDPLKFPAMVAWRNNFLNHSLIKGEYLPPNADVVSYFQSIREKFLPVYASS